jgi:hypothetical protein
MAQFHHSYLNFEVSAASREKFNSTGLLGSNTVQPWRCRQYVPLKRWHQSTSPHSVTTQKTNTDIFTAVRTLNLIQLNSNINSSFITLQFNFSVFCWISKSTVLKWYQLSLRTESHGFTPKNIQWLNPSMYLIH